MPSSRITAETIRSQLPCDFERLVARAVQTAYAVTRRMCDRKFGPEGDDLRGHLLRAFVQRQLREAMAPLPGVTTEFASNSPRTSKYLRIRFGRVIVTDSVVETASTLVRHADFRETLACSSQLELFPESGDETSDRPLYLLLLHGPCGARSMPAFIDLVPPTRDCTSYLEEARIRLLRDVAQQAAEASPPEIVAPPSPELLPNADEAGRRA